MVTHLQPATRLTEKMQILSVCGVSGVRTHGEEVGAALGLLPDGRGRVGGLRHVDAQLLLARAGRGRHRGRVVAQAAAAVTRLERTRRHGEKLNSEI